VGIAKKGNSESTYGRPEISVYDLTFEFVQGKELGYRTADGGVEHRPSNMLLPHEKSICEMRWAQTSLLWIVSVVDPSI
jgi:hypothetical protein